MIGTQVRTPVTLIPALVLLSYVLKPIEEDRLETALAKVREHVERKGAISEKQRLLEFVMSLTGQPRDAVTNMIEAPELVHAYPDRISIRDGGEITRVPVADIDWIDAAGDYMCIHVSGETHIMRSTLKSLMEKLDPEKFKRIHRSTVVNLDRIVKATAQSKGEYLLLLDCEHELKVSRNYRMEIRNFLNEH